MRITEDKTAITKKLFELLKMTRAFADLTDLKYFRDDYTETVTAVFQDETISKINVRYDSGITLIKDVLRGLS